MNAGRIAVDLKSNLAAIRDFVEKANILKTKEILEKLNKEINNDISKDININMNYELDNVIIDNGDNILTNVISENIDINTSMIKTDKIAHSTITPVRKNYNNENICNELSISNFNNDVIKDNLINDNRKLSEDLDILEKEFHEKMEKIGKIKDLSQKRFRPEVE